MSNHTIPFIARLARKADGVSCFGEFEAQPDVASALIAAHERFGADYHVRLVYPKSFGQRVNFDPDKLRAAAAAPTLNDEPAYDPNFDPCLWDAGRIEATKTLLFHEHIGGR